MSATTTIENETAPESADGSVLTVLTAAHRCDRCGAQAYVLSVRGPSKLLWCAHHFTHHEPALTGQGYTVAIDDRAKLDPSPS